MAFCQYNNVWVFGNRAGVDFNKTPPEPIKTELLHSLESCASVSDGSGKLLFYTDGSTVWNAGHTVMPNGKDLNPIVSIEYDISSTSSTTQGTVIIPMPDSIHKYYIFSLTSLTGGPLKTRGGRLYYSVVDMRLNGGLGDVVTGHKAILIDTGLTERMTAVVGDDCNVWLLNVAKEGVIKAREITTTGISSTPILSNINGITAADDALAGCMAVSPDRSMIAIAVNVKTISGLFLFDFDPLSGIVSNERELLSPEEVCYGVCFSPDNTKIYTTQNGGYSNPGQLGIYQLDLSAGSLSDIIQSKILVGGTGSGTSVGTISHLKRAPDQKIYFRGSRNSSNSFLSVINFPNEAGLACQLQDSVIMILPGSETYYGLPNEVPVINQTIVHSSVKKDSFDCFISHPTISAFETSGWDYMWNTGSSASSITIDSPGIYWVGYFLPSCIYRIDTFEVYFPNGVLPHIHTLSSCANDATGAAWANTYPGDTVTYFYTWYAAVDTTPLSVTDSLRNVPSGNYYVHIRTRNGCDTIVRFFLPDKEPYNASFDVSDTLICAGDDIQFRNTSEVYFNTWYWSFGDGATSALLSPVHNYSQPGIYEAMMVAKGEICMDTAYTTIIVDQPIDELSFFTDRRELCIGEAVYFEPDADSSTTALLWKFGDGTGFAAGVESLQKHAYDVPGVMYVQLSAQFRVCPAISFTDSVIVHPLPLVSLGPDSAICLHSSAIIIQNQHGSGDDYKYLWNTGATTSAIEVRHQGSYSLTVSNTFGCATTESIVVNKDCHMDIPNSFTPNGDGINDYFFPTGLLSSSLSFFSMTILNRWGQVIFKTTKADSHGWDGKFNQQDQPMGAYIYIIDAVFANDQKEQYQGTVTLLR